MYLSRALSQRRKFSRTIWTCWSGVRTAGGRRPWMPSIWRSSMVKAWPWKGKINSCRTELLWRIGLNCYEDKLCVFNSLAPGRSESDSKNIIFNLILLIGVFRSSHDNAIWWMPPDLIDDKSTLVQVMAWCRQATRHYLGQCWLSSLSPYDIARS